MAKKIAMDGKTWLNYSISVWDDIRKSTEEAGLKHPALFPAQMASRLIQLFSHPGETVLDPFCGTGSTLLAAHHLDRKGIGIDISHNFLALAEKRLIQDGSMDHRLLCGDARRVEELVEETVDFCLTSPPYWDILNQKRTADLRDQRHYGNLEDDLGTIKEYGHFLEEVALVFRGIYRRLRPQGYCCIVVMDLRKKNQFYPLHMDLSRILTEEGYTLDDLIIWDRRHEYNRLRPLGYPYVFRVNRIHEYILILQKRV